MMEQDAPAEFRQQRHPQITVLEHTGLEGAVDDDGLVKRTVDQSVAASVAYFSVLHLMVDSVSDTRSPLARARRFAGRKPPATRQALRTRLQFSRSSVMCRGSCFSSPRSTFLTMSVSTALARQVMPSFSPSRTIWPLMNSISVRRPFCHVLAHRRALPGRRRPASQALLVTGLHRCFVALASAGDRLRRQMQNVLELIAVRLANADRLAAEPRREMADRLALEHLAAADQPVQAESPFCMALATSFDQRSPHRLLVTLALSAMPTSRPTSCARSVMRPCTSPARNTVCAAPRLPAPR